jgi:hypothetical protein
MTARSTAQGHAATIRDETAAGANTATRVGTNLRELADNAAFTEDIGTSFDLTSTALPAALPANNMRGVIEVNYATTTTLPACTYANGTLGVGATLTGNANGALAAQDGQSPAANDIILVKDQASGLQNGVYVVTTLGDGSNPFVLTRIVAAATAANLSGCQVSVLLGTANANTAWTINLAAASITVGTTALTFVNPHTSATVPAALSTAAAGTSPHLARRDHVHTMPSADQLATCAGAVPLNNNNLTGVKTAVLNGLIDDGNSSTSKTIDFTTGLMHKLTLTGNCALTLTNPSGPATCLLLLTQDGSGSRTISFVTTVISAGGAVPVPTSTATTGKTMLMLVWDGTNWWCTAAYGFA